MKMSGHLTAKVFQRYRIHSNADLERAADVIDALAAAPKKKAEKKTARVTAFRRRA